MDRRAKHGRHYCGSMTTENAARSVARVAAFLRLEAYSRSVSQGSIAEAAGVSRSAMNEYLNGRMTLPLGTFFDICFALGLEPDEVLREGRKQDGQ